MIISNSKRRRFDLKCWWKNVFRKFWGTLLQWNVFLFQLFSDTVPESFCNMEINHVRVLFYTSVCYFWKWAAFIMPCYFDLVAIFFFVFFFPVDINKKTESLFFETKTRFFIIFLIFTDSEKIKKSAYAVIDSVKENS